MNALTTSLRQTLRLRQLVWLIYGITLVLSLLAALPFYATLKVEDQNSRAFLNLLDGFDYTVFSDFMHRSERAIDPLLSVGRWLGILSIFLSVFFASGILHAFSPAMRQFHVGTFWQVCIAYFRRFLPLFGVTLLFILAGAGIWLVVGSLAGILVSDTLTERGLFWIGILFFSLFVLTATLFLCIGDYAKVITFRDDEPSAFRAFGRAGRLVLGNPGPTYGLYWLFIGIVAGLFGIYFLIDSLILMRNWPTIVLMLVVQQALIFARTGLRVWSLGAAYQVYETLPKPVMSPPPTGITLASAGPASFIDPDKDGPTA